MKHLFLVLLCSTLLFSACEPPAPQLEQEQLVGLWQFSEGTINGTSANDLLSDLFFEFSPTQVSSELLPELATGFSKKEPYTIDGMSIIINDKLTVEVTKVEDGQLSLELTTAQANNPLKVILTLEMVGGVRVEHPGS